MLTLGRRPFLDVCQSNTVNANAWLKVSSKTTEKCKTGKHHFSKANWCFYDGGGESCLTCPKSLISVQSGWNLVTVKAIAFDLHHLHTHQTTQGTLMSCGRGGIILEETTTIRIEIFYHRKNVINQNNFVLNCIETSL